MLSLLLLVVSEVARECILALAERRGDPILRRHIGIWRAPFRGKFLCVNFFFTSSPPKIANAVVLSLMMMSRMELLLGALGTFLGGTSFQRCPDWPGVGVCPSVQLGGRLGAGKPGLQWGENERWGNSVASNFFWSGRSVKLISTV